MGAETAAAAWLERLVDEVLASPQALFDFFRGKKRSEDLTVPIINQMLAFIRAVHNRTTKQASCVQYLYYWVLEFVLRQLHPIEDAVPGERFRKAAAVDPAGALSKLSCPDFHKSILSVALEVVAVVLPPDGQQHQLFKSISAAGFQHNMLSVWHSLGWFQACFAAGRPHSMPPELLALLEFMKMRCVEELVLAEGSHAYEIMFSGGGSFFEPGDKKLLEDFLSAMAQLAVDRTACACQRLASGVVAAQAAQPQAQAQAQELAASLATAAVQLVDHVLGSHLDVCFGVHLSVICACSIFCVAKAMKTALQFKTILQDLSVAAAASFAVLDSLSVDVQHRELESVFKSVSWQSLQGADGKEQQESGDIRQFYNSIFLSRVEDVVHGMVEHIKKPAVMAHAQVIPEPSPAPIGEPAAAVLAAAPQAPAATDVLRRAFRPIAAAYKQAPPGEKFQKPGSGMAIAVGGGAENTPVKEIKGAAPDVRTAGATANRGVGKAAAHQPGGDAMQDACTQTPDSVQSKGRLAGLDRLLTFASLPLAQSSPSFRHYR